MKVFIDTKSCKQKIIIGRQNVMFCQKLVKGPGSLFMWVGVKIMRWAYFFREKGWAKREFHDVLGWVIVCFVKNHTHYNSCGRSK